MFANNIVPVIMVVCFGSLLVTAHKYQRVEDFDQRVIVKKCDETYTILAGQCYKFHQNRCNWDTACQVCQSEGAQLASVITQDQYDALLGHINANYAGTYWTSGRTEGGRWVWTATQPRMSVAPQWWGRSNPSKAMGQCAYFCSNTLKYWNKSCSHSLRFICEKSPKVLNGFVSVEPQ